MHTPSAAESRVQRGDQVRFLSSLEATKSETAAYHFKKVEFLSHLTRKGWGRRSAAPGHRIDQTLLPYVPQNSVAT